MADEEIADPKKYLEEACKPKCVKSLIEYEACIKRIEADDTDSKHCTGACNHIHSYVYTYSGHIYLFTARKKPKHFDPLPWPLLE